MDPIVSRPPSRPLVAHLEQVSEDLQSGSGEFGGEKQWTDVSNGGAEIQYLGSDQTRTPYLHYKSRYALLSQGGGVWLIDMSSLDQLGETIIAVRIQNYNSDLASVSMSGVDRDDLMQLHCLAAAELSDVLPQIKEFADRKELSSERAREVYMSVLRCILEEAGKLGATDPRVELIEKGKI